MHYDYVLRQAALKQHRYRLEAERDALAEEFRSSRSSRSLKQKLGLALVELGQRLAREASPQQA